MTTVPIAEAKARFSQLVQEVAQGHDVVVTRGVGREPVAALIPIAAYQASRGVSLGLAAGWNVTVPEDSPWELSDEQFLEG
ncbi:MAG: type II toxin-antitoxin system prevent-host-death family antitoxin [Bifidobacteriaceae bacterium]|jgi:prevent-host-death family protein|nr:type II toxin-antitoxin system prevent-host-death family antitoxin [Bifidobacteriaceae bacterium]